MKTNYYIELRNLLLDKGKEFSSRDIDDLPKVKGIYIMFENGQYDDDRKARIIRVGKADRNFQTRLEQHFFGTIKNSVFRKHILSALLNKKIDKKYNATKNEEQKITDFLQNITFRLVRVPKLLTCEELESMCIRTVAKHSKEELKSPTLDKWIGWNCTNNNVKGFHIWNSDDVNYKNELDAYYFDLIECGLVRK